MSIEISIADDERIRARAFAFRYQVHVVELGKGGPGVDHAGREIRDDADDDAVLFVATEGDRIVGTARVNHGGSGPVPTPYAALFDTEPAEARFERRRVAITSRLMVDPAYRGRTLASLLVMRLYDWGLRQGTDVDFCMAEPALLRTYYRLGYRPYRQAVRPGGAGLRVPLVLALRDRGHLLHVESPFAMLLPESTDDGGRTAAALAELYPGFEDDAPALRGDLRTLWARYADGLTRRARRGLLDDLDEGQRELVLARAAALRFQPGEVVQRRAEHSSLGVVLDGRLGVGVPTEGGWHWLELLGPGDVFGDPEPGGALPRAVELVALEPTRTALLTENVVEKLGRHDPALAMRLAMNLVTVLRQRVDDLHRRGVASRGLGVDLGRALTPLPAEELAR